MQVEIDNPVWLNKERALTQTALTAPEDTTTKRPEQRIKHADDSLDSFTLSPHIAIGSLSGFRGASRRRCTSEFCATGIAGIRTADLPRRWIHLDSRVLGLGW